MFTKYCLIFKNIQGSILSRDLPILAVLAENHML